MSHLARFGAYAAAFEKAFESDDWSEVAPFFSEDAVYQVDLDPPMGGTFEGREAILAYFKEILDGFDRKFETREIKLEEGPEEEGDSIWLRGAAIYRAEGIPEFVLSLKETATFEGDRIVRLHDEYEPAMKDDAEAFLAEHGSKLGIDFSS